jgi:hypothetical protein
VSLKGRRNRPERETAIRNRHSYREGCEAVVRQVSLGGERQRGETERGEALEHVRHRNETCDRG